MKRKEILGLVALFFGVLLISNFIIFEIHVKNIDISSVHLNNGNGIVLLSFWMTNKLDHGRELEYEYELKNPASGKTQAVGNGHVEIGKSRMKEIYSIPQKTDPYLTDLHDLSMPVIVIIVLENDQVIGQWKGQVKLSE